MKKTIFISINTFTLISFILAFVVSCESPTEPEPPDAVSLTNTEEVTSSSVKLNWSQNTDSNFSHYKIYRSSSYTVSENSSLVSTIYSQYETSYTVTGLTENSTYYFKVYVYNDDGLSAGSNTLPVTTAELIETQDHTTNYQGISTFEIGGYDVEVETKDENGNAISNVGLTALVTPNYLIVVTNDQNYYSDIEIVPLSGSLSKERSIIGITFALIGVGLWIHEMYTEPPYIEDIINEDGITERCITGDLNDVMSTLAVISGGFGNIFHVGQSAASALGYTSKTASLTAEAINGGVDLFAALMGEVFNIFDEDILHLCWGVDDNEEVVTPMYCDEIELIRPFDLKITLTWGENPQDLDSHLWTPSISGNTHHVYFANPGSEDYPPYAELDVDDVSSWGPENITIKELYSGTYYYSVYHYSGSGTITTSEANVTVLGQQGELYDLNVPSGSAGDNWWWNVLQINGSTGNISIINEISSSPPSGTLARAIDWNLPK